MILPTIRASLSRSDAICLAGLISDGEPEAHAAALERLDESGVDALLDDPRALDAAFTTNVHGLRPELVFYLLLRHALLEGGVADGDIADYVASVVYGFRHAGRAYRLTDDPGPEYRDLTDHLERLTVVDAPGKFMVNLHLGDFALWMTGIFPDHVSARVRRRGAPPRSYFEDVGIAGYRRAASSDQARRMGLDDVLASVAAHFGGVRVALNRFADRYMFRGGGDPVERLIREVCRGGT